jgi:hypothetical protein
VPAAPTTTSPVKRPASPRSCLLELSRSTPNVPSCVYETLKAAEAVFSQPRSLMSPSVVPKDIVLPRVDSKAPVAIHARVGRDQVFGEEEEEEEELSFFSPRIAESTQSIAHDCRQWAIVAQAGHFSSFGGDAIQLFAIPLGWRDGVQEEDELGHFVPTDVPFYLTTNLHLPVDCVVQDVAFYSDDGKSSLSSGTDSGTGKEGRQKLGLLIRQNHDKQLQLWLIDYNPLLWQAVSFESILVNAENVLKECCAKVEPLNESNSDGNDGEDQMDDDDHKVVLAESK